MTSSRVPPSASSRRRQPRRVLLAAVCLCLGAAGPLAAQSGGAGTSGFAQGLSNSPDTWVLSPPAATTSPFASAVSAPVTSASGSIAGQPNTTVFEQRVIEGFGMNGRLGHITGPAVGHRESFTYFELAPFTTYENSWINGDFRFLRTNTGNLAGTGGGVFRQYLPGYNVILGFNAFYDLDDTRGRQFEQFGCGFELLSEWLDIRSNLYFPQGSTAGVIASGIQPNSAAFVGNQIQFSSFTTSATAGEGVDLLFTVPVPFQWAQAVNLEASAGWYHFETNDSGLPKVNGWKMRVDGSAMRKLLHMYVELTGDHVFERNIVLGVDINYWHQGDPGPRVRGNQWNRISQWVERNWTVVTVDDTVITTGNVAINPATGNPYFIEHVDSNVPGGGTGTFEDPFNTIQAAQTTPPGPPDPATAADNIIFVHAGSVFNTPLVMQDGETIFGEGPVHQIPVQGFPGLLSLPSTGKLGGVPTFDGIAGVPVTLADNVTLSGFQITNTVGGPAILADNIAGTNLISNILIDGVTGGSGIVVNNSAGATTFQNVDVNDADGDAFVIADGNAQVTFRNGTINNTLNRAVRITGAGGSFNFAGSSINDTGDGIIVEDFTGAGTFNTANLDGGTFDVLDTSGSVTWLNALTISNPAGNAENPNGFAIQVDNLSGTLSFGTNANITITGRDAVGINLNDVSGSFVSLANTSIGATSPAGTTTAGVRFRNSSGVARFFNLNVNGASAAVIVGDPAGVNVNSPGALFAINGTFNFSNTTSVGLGALSVFDNADVTTNGGTINNRDGRGILVDTTTGLLNFGGATTINNQLASLVPAVDVQNATGAITFGSVTVNGALGPAPAVLIDNNAAIGIGGLNVDYTGTGALALPPPTFPFPIDNLPFDEFAVSITDNGAVSIGSGVINAVSGGGIILGGNSSIAVTLNSVSASGDTVGIAVFDNPGSFTVTGAGGPGTGGTITGMDAQGALFDYTDQDPLSTGNAVSLSFMNINGSLNQQGILAGSFNPFAAPLPPNGPGGLNRLTLTGMSLIGNANAGLRANNIVNLTITDSIFIDNGQGRGATANPFGDHVYALIGINPANTVFTYRIERNQFVDQGASGDANDSMVAIRNTGFPGTGGGAGAVLDLIVQDNGVPTANGAIGFQANRSDPTLQSRAAALAVNWNGTIQQALVQRNNFLLQGGVGQTGVSITNSATTGTSNVQVINNRLVTNAADDAVGAFFDFSNQTTLVVAENRSFDPLTGAQVAGFVMNGDDSEGFSFTFRSGGSTLILDSNQVDFNADDGIGFNFPFTNGNQLFVINNNVVNHNVNNFFNVGPGERGFAFGPIIGTILFSGSVNNQVNFFDPDIFSVDFPTLPGGSFSGSILVNGVPRP